jgi:lactate dehydrogenase-like 2-hydroxyacid dehydrogenase
VRYTSRAAKPDLDRTGAERRDLESLLRESDCVTLHAALNDATHHLIGRDQLALMKPGAALVNTARGGIVDEIALLEALESGQIGAAGLDVFEGEPDVKPELLEHPKVLALPHIGSATVRTRKAMANLAFRNASLVLSGRDPLTPVTR